MDDCLKSTAATSFFPSVTRRQAILSSMLRLFAAVVSRGPMEGAARSFRGLAQGIA